MDIDANPAIQLPPTYPSRASSTDRASPLKTNQNLKATQMQAQGTPGLSEGIMSPDSEARASSQLTHIPMPSPTPSSTQTTPKATTNASLPAPPSVVVTPPPPRQRRDSWPPTQVRISGNGLGFLRPEDAMALSDGDLDLANIDEDPFTYFLTPVPSNMNTAERGQFGFDDDEEEEEVDHMEDDDSDDRPAFLAPGGLSRTSFFEDAMELDIDLDLDAGIETPNHPRDIVRSVSPSSLSDSMDIRKPRSGRNSGGASPSSLSPDRASGSGSPTLTSGPATPPDVMNDDDGSNGEDYLRFPGAGGVGIGLGLALTLSELRGSGTSGKGKPVLVAPHRTPLPSGARANSRQHHAAPVVSRGRQTRRVRGRRGAILTGGGGTAAGRFPARQSPPHAWREPSPDVWSIEEEEDEHDEELAEQPSGQEEMRIVLPGEDSGARESSQVEDDVQMEPKDTQGAPDVGPARAVADDTSAPPTPTADAIEVIEGLLAAETAATAAVEDEATRLVRFLEKDHARPFGARRATDSALVTAKASEKVKKRVRFLLPLRQCV